MVHNPVDHGGGHLVVPEHLEEESHPVRVERQNPELVDHEQSDPFDERLLPVELPPVAGPAQAHHEGGGGQEEARPEPPLAGRRAQRRGHVRLVGPDVAHEDEVLAPVEKV